MGTSSRVSNRLAGRSAPEHSANSTASNSSGRNVTRTGAASTDKPTVTHGLSVLPTVMSKNSAPLSVLLRKYWKKINDKDSEGRRSRLGNMFAAFKMGLYFKIFITLILFMRLASHSSQMAYPSGAVGRDEHFFSIASAPVSPALRIIVMTDAGYSDGLKDLLESLSEANYDKETVALDIWMFASSTCNYLPLPVYPLAVAIFGPPRFDHSIAGVVRSVSWEHGDKTLIAVRSEPDWSRTWEPSRGTANETLLFVDATAARSLSPDFYSWLKQAQLATKRGMMASTGVFSLDSLRIPDGVPASDRAVLIEQFFPATAAFSPTQDVWVTFLKWHTVRTKTWFARPSLESDSYVGGYGFVESLRVYPVRAWFTQFLALYKERVLHPVLPDNQALVLRSPGSVGNGNPGTGGEGHVRIDHLSELEANKFDGSLKGVTVPERPVLVKANGNSSTADATFGVYGTRIPGRTRGADIEDLVDKEASTKYRAVLRQIGEFARSRGTESISFSLVTGSFVDMTLSWLCNVVYLNIVPPAIVFVTSDDVVSESLTSFIAQHPRLEQGSLVVSMEGALTAVAKAPSPNSALHFGSSEYWMLMLQRTFLLRDLLERGIAVLQFETDQIWLNDPMPYIQQELQDGARDNREDEELAQRDGVLPDMVVTINTRNEVAGNFFYLRPTVTTRHILSTVVDRFFISYSSSLGTEKVRRKEFHYIANDQSLLTNLVLGHDWLYRHHFPGVKYRVLDEQLFVDGTWFLDFEDENGKRVTKRTYYQSEASLFPVVINNNFVVGVEAKMKRAERFAFWFLADSPVNGTTASCDADAVKRAARSGSSKEHREASVVEIGRTNSAL